MTSTRHGSGGWRLAHGRCVGRTFATVHGQGSFVGRLPLLCHRLHLSVVRIDSELDCAAGRRAVVAVVLLHPYRIKKKKKIQIS